MNPLTGLTDYLGRVERRLRVLAFTKGAAITAAAALVFTVLAVLLANAFAFSDPSVAGARVLLFVALALALGIGLVVPLLRLNRRNAARETEQKFPEFEERLLTFTERARTNPDDPFLPLLAADTLAVARQAEPARVAGRNRILSFVAGAAGSLAVLVWLGTSGPGFLGYGTSLLWGGLPKGELAPYYDISVQPGNRTVRRLRGSTHRRAIEGLSGAARRACSPSMPVPRNGSRPTCVRKSSGTGYEFLIAGVPESLEYYVEAGGVRSKQYHLKVVDLPGIKKLKVTYHFPGWTGMKDKVEDPGGDLRAVEGTEADVAIETDRPLANGALLFDDGTKLLLRAGENGLRMARVPIRKDGMYHIAAVDQGEDVRLSPDYFIEAEKDEPPTVRITRPERDARVNPIEEVTVAVEGQDDFGLNDLSLHYSVNGDAEKTVSLLKSKGLQTASGTTTIALEDFKLSPGDLVSLYATSRDAHSAGPHRYVLRAGGAVRAALFAIAGIRRRHGRRRSGRQQDLGTRKRDHRGHLEPDQRYVRRQGRGGRERRVPLGRAVEAARPGAVAVGPHEGAPVGRVERRVQGVHRRYGRGREGHGAGGGQAARLAMAERARAGAEGLAASAARRSRDARYQGGLRQSRGRRRGGGSGADRDLQSLFDLELDTEKNQYESGQRSASKDQRQQRDRRSAAEARTARPAAAGTGRTAAAQPAGFAAALAAGDAAPRGRGTAAQDGAALAESARAAAIGTAAVGPAASAARAASSPARAARCRPNNCSAPSSSCGRPSRTCGNPLPPRAKRIRGARPSA